MASIKRPACARSWNWSAPSVSANPYMQEIVRLLQAQGKRIIVTSNMYLRAAQLRELLSVCGYDLDEIYVSCEQGCSKLHGVLQKKLSGQFAGHSVIHIRN